MDEVKKITPEDIKRLIGDSYVEWDQIYDQVLLAGKVLLTAKEKGVEISLPSDHLIRNKETDEIKVVEGLIPEGWYGVDIGTETINDWVKDIESSGVGVIAGPVGICDDPAIPVATKGTEALMRALEKIIGISAGGETTEFVTRIKVKLTHKSIGGGSTLELIEKGTLVGLDALIQASRLESDAQKLNVEAKELRGFVNNDITIHNAQGGQALGTFTDDVLKYLQTLSSEALKNMRTQVIIVDPNFFRAGGVKSALEIVAKLSKVVRIALYGENAEKIKTLIGNENIITAKDIETLYSILLNMDVGNAIVLRSQDELPDNMKLVVRNVGDMQIVSSQLPTLAIAKALKELLNVKEIDDAFEKFLGQIKTDNVISEQAYNSNRAELLAKLKKGQIFEFSPDLKPTPAVTEKTEVEAARKQCEEFLTKIGV
jgi:hypothetical protein